MTEYTLMFMNKERLVQLHSLLGDLKNFTKQNYFPEDRPPLDGDVEALEMYIERVVERLPKLSTPPSSTPTDGSL